MDWNTIKTNIVTFFQTSGLDILKAIGALILGILIVKLLVVIAKRILSRTKMEKATQGFICQVIKVLLYICLIFVIAQILGISMTGFVAVISAAGLAIGLALQDSLSNLANGILLISAHPFKEDDYVSINGQEGTVKSLGMLHTTIVTPDNKIINVPNSSVMSNNIVNYTASGTRKIVFDFGVDYSSNTEQVKDIIAKVMLSNGKVKTTPAPFVSLKEMKDSSINFIASCWCDSEDYWDIYYYVLDNTFNEFKKNNISIPYNQMEVRLRDDKVILPYNKKELPQRVEKIHKKQETVLDELAKTFRITKKPKVNKLTAKSKKTESKQIDKK